MKKFNKKPKYIGETDFYNNKNGIYFYRDSYDKILVIKNKKNHCETNWAYQCINLFKKVTRKEYSICNFDVKVFTY